MAIPVVVAAWGLVFLIRVVARRFGFQTSFLEVRPGFIPNVIRVVGLGVSPGISMESPLIGIPLTIAMLPWIWFATVSMRLGAPQLAARIAYVSPWFAWSPQAKSARLVLMANRALVAPEDKIVRAAEQMIHLTEDSGNGATALAGAFFAVSRGNTEVALELFGGVALIRRTLVPRWMRARANHVRLAAAAQHGNWSEVLAWAGQGPRTPTSLVFACAAKHCLGRTNAMTDVIGWSAWLVAPHRVHTWRLLRWARNRTLRVAAGYSGAVGLPALLALQETQPGTASCAALERAAESLSGLERNDALVARITQRAIALGVQTGAQTEICRLQEAVREELIRHLTQMWTPASDYPTILAPLVEEARLRLFDELEQEMQTLCSRDAPHELVIGVAFWTMWGRLRIRFAQVWVVFPESRPMLMSLVEEELTSLGAKLHNIEKQPKLASDIFALLYQGRGYLLDQETRGRVKSNYKVGE